MNDDVIAQLRTAWETTKIARDEANRVYNAIKDDHEHAKRALEAALAEQYGPVDGKIVQTKAHGEVRLSYKAYLDSYGNFCARGHDRIKNGTWSRSARVTVMLIPAPAKEPVDAS